MINYAWDFGIQPGGIATVSWKKCFGCRLRLVAKLIRTARLFTRLGRRWPRQAGELFSFAFGSDPCLDDRVSARLQALHGFPFALLAHRPHAVRFAAQGCFIDHPRFNGIILFHEMSRLLVGPFMSPTLTGRETYWN